MKLPYNMRASTLEERKKFYKRFDLKKARDWVGRKLVYSVIIGRHSGVFPIKYAKDKNEPLIIDKYKDLKDAKKQIIKFLPEGVYYDRNYYHEFSLCHAKDLRDVWNWENFAGQELAFDLDPENVTCPVHGTFAERFAKGWGLRFCKIEFKIICKNTIYLYDKLKENYSDVRIVFSGRGFHIHVFDKDTRLLSRQKRNEIANKYQEFGIDPWVTNGEMRFIRLPFSLNGISSRIVLPLSTSELTEFDPKKDALPFFLDL